MIFHTLTLKKIVQMFDKNLTDLIICSIIIITNVWR